MRMKLGVFELNCFGRSVWRDGKICWQKPGAEWASFLAVNLVRCNMVTPVIPFGSFWVLCVAGAFDVSQTKSIVEIHVHWLWYWTVFWSLGKKSLSYDNSWSACRCAVMLGLVLQHTLHCAVMLRLSKKLARGEMERSHRQYMGWWCIWATPVL